MNRPTLSLTNEHRTLHLSYAHTAMPFIVGLLYIGDTEVAGGIARLDYDEIGFHERVNDLLLELRSTHFLLTDGEREQVERFLAECRGLDATPLLNPETTLAPRMNEQDELLDIPQFLRQGDD